MKEKKPVIVPPKTSISPANIKRMKKQVTAIVSKKPVIVPPPPKQKHKSQKPSISPMSKQIPPIMARGRPEIYGDAIKSMRTMRQGDSFLMTPPPGKDAAWLNNSFTVAVFRAERAKNPLKPPTGCRFVRRSSQDGKQLVVMCLPRLKRLV